MAQTHEMLEKFLNNFLKLVIISELMNIDIDANNLDRLLKVSSDIAVDLSIGIARRKFGNDKTKKIKEGLSNAYLWLQSTPTTPELYYLLMDKLSRIVTEYNIDLAWKELEELENYLLELNKKKEVKDVQLGKSIETISDMKKILINYLASIQGEADEAFLIMRDEVFNLILGNNIYELKINGLSDNEKKSSDSFRLSNALKLLLDEEDKIRNKKLMGEVFTISKVKDKEGRIINVLISFATAKEILNLRESPNISVKLLRKVEDFCIFLSGSTLYGMVSCNVELDVNSVYTYKGENIFEKISQP
ncbi:hypothetical protein SULI_14295 [Saccharolobus solfataricus]|uniref:Uncharacterized protein n=3 Tax=Saccharolobus solfataricus TaxID=2287 RepID=Q97WQ3_SACS2|nr:hypothetical protein [Saccharolobus solfataricus]AAK42249.1 Hypothetical protein SSO2066 [Saccharolobus solfataricus P2]AKA74865.1 hypothetical protein SULB_2807 [Saccharolobus solfataricus]AKA77561.1 hypothetical protein SULC_2804 [Saccharolobus solfataricus]AKA80251.1 hypothetical protein SULA_2806 [Saccharolobus solfataricus]AZF69331.1 hypothetical protein SULG_14295 [Saccharolobus solfataricus]